MGAPLFDCSSVASSWITSQCSDEDSVFDADNICGNPIHREPEIAKSAVHDDEITFGHDDSRFVFKR